MSGNDLSDTNIPSDLPNFNPTQILKRETLPPIITQVLLSEFLILAATLTEYAARPSVDKKYNEIARLVVKRVQEIARGASPNLISPSDFKERLAAIMKHIERIG
jgi:hypothetical protein